MIIDAMQLTPESGELSGEVCVIGGGAAGLTLTRELARRGIDVITLEGGGLKETRRSQEIYRGDNEGRKYFKLHRARRRYLGGSTNCWAGLCARLRPQDFEARSWIPHSGWPISRRDLDAYYERAGDVLQIGAFHPELDVERSPDQHLSGPGLKLSGFESTFFQMSKPVRLGQEWREALTAEPKARIVYNANVTHLQLAESGGHLDHVVCQAFGGQPFKVRARRFVLACGAIENPRMLLNARDVARSGIGNEHDLVGRFFMEHPHIDRESLWVPNGHAPSLTHYRNRKRRAQGDRIWSYLRPTAHKLRAEELLDFSLVLFKRRLKREEERHPLLREVFESTQHMHQGAETRGRTQKIRTPYTFGNPMEQAPNPQSRVTLDSAGARDELGLIRAELHWELSALEKRTLRRAHELIAESLCRADYGRVRVTPTLDLNSFPPQTKGGYHHMGTTRMSDNPKTGIVNADCQVFGVSNLYIAGSSVFTTGGAANPTLTIVALALRLAEHLASTSNTLQVNHSKQTSSPARAEESNP